MRHVHAAAFLAAMFFGAYAAVSWITGDLPAAGTAAAISGLAALIVGFVDFSTDRDRRRGRSEETA